MFLKTCFQLLHTHRYMWGCMHVFFFVPRSIGLKGRRPRCMINKKDKYLVLRTFEDIANLSATVLWQENAGILLWVSLFFVFAGSETNMLFSKWRKKKYFWGQQIQLTFKKKSIIQKKETKKSFSELTDALTHTVYNSSLWIEPSHCVSLKARTTKPLWVSHNIYKDCNQSQGGETWIVMFQSLLKPTSSAMNLFHQYVHVYYQFYIG